MTKQEQEEAALVIETLKTLTRKLGISRQQLGDAMDFSPESLKPNKIKMRSSTRVNIVYALRKLARSKEVVALGLDADQRRVLDEQSEVLAKRLFLLEDDETKRRRRRCLESIEIGLDFFEKPDWRLAKSHLSEAWAYFSKHPPDEDDSYYGLVLLASGQLASLHNHHNEVPMALRIHHQLQNWLSSRRGNTPLELQTSIASVHINAAITTRLHEPAWSEPAVALCRKGISAFGDNLPNPATSSYPVRHQLCAAWRDQAKPLCYSAWRKMGAQMKVCGREHPPVKDALHALSQAQRWCGGREPFDDQQVDWLLTALTHMECLASCGMHKEALELQASVYGQRWVDKLLNIPRNAPLRAKAAVVSLALAYCQDQLTGVLSKGECILSSIDAEHFAERHLRVQQAIAYADTGNEADFLGLLVR